jgi:HEAT repeat protein
MISKPGFIDTRSCRFRITLAQLFALALISLSVSGQTAQQKNPSATELLDQFKSEKVFWRQLELARKIVALHDTSVLPELVGWLNHDDRHLRGNVAFIFSGLGDDRGFEVISAILKDRSDRPEGQGQVWASSDGRYHIEQQIRADRYYAVHLFGGLKSARAVPVLVPLLRDPELNYNVAWALGEIGDKSAIHPLIETLQDRSPDVRVDAIQALEKLGAREALPDLRALLNDQETTRFHARTGKQVSVAEIAQEAIVKLEAGSKAN